MDWTGAIDAWMGGWIGGMVEKMDGWMNEGT